MNPDKKSSDKIFESLEQYAPDRTFTPSAMAGFLLPSQKQFGENFISEDFTQGGG